MRLRSSALSKMAFDSACYFALSALVLSTVVILLQEPLLSLSLKGTRKFSGFLPVYAYLLVLNPLTFYLNMLLLIRHVAGHPTAHAAPLQVFLTNHLPGAAQIFSLFTLLFDLPLCIQLALSEGSMGLAIGALLVCIALISVLTSVLFKKFFVTYNHAGRGFVPAIFALCISTATFMLFDPVLSFPNTKHSDGPLMSIALDYLLLCVIFLIFILGMTLVILCIAAPAAGNQAAIQAKYFTTVAFCLAISIVLVCVYMKLFLAASYTGAAGPEIIKRWSY